MTQTFGLNPGLDSDGDHDPAEDLWDAANDGTWKPECWSKSPIQLQEEARAMNHAAFASAAANAGKHSNAPNMPHQRSC